VLNHSEKFRELHREFCSANAKWFSKGFELEATSAWENRLETGLYELLSFSPIPEQPKTQFGVLAPLTEFYEEPLEDYKRLAVEAWTFLPMDYRRLVFDVLENDRFRLAPVEPYHYWTDLLWFLAACLELNDSFHNDESKSENDDLPSVYVMNPFYFSAIFIENFELATDAPIHPDKCEVIDKFFGWTADDGAPAGKNAAEAGGLASIAEQRAAWVGKALMLRRANPNMTKADIARKVGIHPGQLSPKRSPELAALEGMLQGGTTSGHITKDSESGLSDVEAVTPTDDKHDRGIQITGSKLFREYCVECGEPMRVTQDEVGTCPRCTDCAR
jgi:hypothetical protein